MNTIARAIAIASITIAAGCKVGVQTDIYTSDVMDVIDGKDGLTTPMVISFQVSGKDGCADAGSGLAGPLAAAYGAADYIGCREVKFDKYADFRVQADVVNEVINDISDSGQPLYIGVRALDSDDGRNWVFVGYFVNDEAMKSLKDSIPSEFTIYMSGNPEIRMSATLSNDLRDNIEVFVDDAFVDGRALQSTQSFTLDRRGEVSISMSDVTNAAVAQGDASAAIAHIPRNKAPD